MTILFVLNHVEQARSKQSELGESKLRIQYHSKKNMQKPPKFSVGKDQTTKFQMVGSTFLCHFL